MRPAFVSTNGPAKAGPYVRIALIACAAAALLQTSVRARGPAEVPSRLAPRHAVSAQRQVPPSFEENAGQFVDGVRFLSRRAGSEIALGPGGAATVSLTEPATGARATLVMTLHGSDPAAGMRGEDQLPIRSNYFFGADPSRWRAGVRHFAKVRYHDVYPGVDAVYYDSGGELEYDFIISPGASAAPVRLRFDGASRVEQDADGSLLLHVGAGRIRHSAPVAYQTRNGAPGAPGGEDSRETVDARYVLEPDGTVGLAIGAYDVSRPLIIDPVLSYSSFLASDDRTEVGDVKVDASGNVYLSGYAGANFRNASSLRPYGGGQTDVFVLRLSPSLTGVSYFTYLGGSGDESRFQRVRLALGVGGSVYVTGGTSSTDFPVTTGAANATPGQGFVAMLNASGALVYSTYLAGRGQGIAVDSSGRAYVAASDTVRRINAAGTAFDWTYASAIDARDVVLGTDSFSNTYVYVTGTTITSVVTVNVSYQGTRGGGEDAYVLGLTPDAGLQVFGTYLGGAADDAGNALSAAGGSIFVTGETQSANFPTSSAVQPANGGLRDVFVTKLDSFLQNLSYSTYLGGNADDIGHDLVVDSGGIAYVTGRTQSPNYPVAAQVQTFGGNVDVFVTKLSPSGATLQYSTYLGGDSEDFANAVAIDQSGNAYLGGLAFSNAFPTTAGALRPTRLDMDAFVAKLGSVSITSVSPNNGPLGGGTAVTLSGANFVAGATVTFGGTAATSVTVVNATTITAITPAHAAGLVDVVVTIGGETATLAGGFTYAVDPLDLDADGLPNAWETQFGLNPNSAAGANGANGDPDVDGSTNAQELSGGTHPRGFYTRYLAEGATSSFFNLRLALLNTNAGQSLVLLRFLKTTGAPVSHYLALNALTRATVDPKTITGLDNAEFSILVESDVSVVVDRTMSWDSGGYGSHAETSVALPALTWYLAEGATHSGFNLFYLVQNPNAASATVQVTYLLTAPAAPSVKSYTVPANARFNIWVNQEGGALASADVSAIITATNNQPIIVERAMYLNAGGQLFGAGHESAGMTAPATSWFLAEGATGPYFDLFILIANPNSQTANATVTYLLPGGTTVTKSYTIAPTSRFNIWVDLEDARLANTAVSATVTSTNGVSILVERSMWWPGDATTWFEAHNSAGSTAAGVRWALAEGEIGGTNSTQTYVLIANTSAFAGSATVQLLFDDGTTASKTFTLAANSRFNVDVGAEFAGASGRRFGAIVTSIGAPPAQIVVERAMYSNAGGTVWAAGTNALATKLQ